MQERAPGNRLGEETSPYLLQHKDNPVDWYPWGEEARAAARERDVPLVGEHDVVGKPIDLHPGNRAFDPADITDVDLDERAALHMDRAFAHHPAGRQVAHLYAMLFSAAIEAQIGHDEKAVTRELPLFCLVHLLALTYLGFCTIGRYQRASGRILIRPHETMINP